MTPPSSKRSLAQEILGKCVIRKNPLKRDGCELRLSIRKAAPVLDMDKDPIKSKMEDQRRQRCDFAAYQHPNPVNEQKCLILVEFKASLHQVNKTLDQLGASLGFLGELSEIPEFAFDLHASALVCKEQIGRREIERLKNVTRIIPGRISVRLRPLVLISGQELTDKQIAEHGQPRPKAAK